MRRVKLLAISVWLALSSCGSIAAAQESGAGEKTIDPALASEDAAARAEIDAIRGADDAAILDLDRRIERLASRLEGARPTAGARLEMAWASRLLLEMGRPLEAERILVRMGKRLEASGDAPGLALVAQHRGIACRMLGRLDEALDWYGRAAEIYSRLGDEMSGARIAANLANVFQDLGRFDEAEVRYAEAAAAFSRLGDEAAVEKVALNRANLLFNAGRLEESLAAYADLAPRFDAPGKEHDRGLIAMNRAVALGRLGRLEASLDESRRAAGLFRRTASAETDLGLLAVNQAATLHALGRWEEALKDLEEAERLLARRGFEMELAGAAVNRAIVFKTLGRNEDALSEYDRAERIIEKTGADHVLANVLAGRALAFDRLGRTERALDDFDRAARIYERLGLELSLAGIWQNRGDLVAALGRHDEALAAYDRAAKVYERYGDDYGLADVAHDRAGVFHATGRLEEALAECDRASGGRRAGEDRLFAAIMAHDRAGVLTSLGRFEEALADYERSANLVEEILRKEVRPLGEDSSQSFRLFFRNAQSGALRCLSRIEERRPPHLAAAYRVAQVFHGLGLAEILAEKGRLRAADVSHDLAAEMEDVASGLRRAESRRTDLLTARAPATLDERLEAKREMDALLSEIGGLAARRERLAERVRLRSRSYAGVVYPRAASLEEVRAVLPPRAALVEYLVDAEGAHAFVLTRGSAEAVSLGDAKEIAADAAEALSGLGSAHRSAAGRDAAAASLRRLGRRILDPVARALSAAESVDTLYVSPDGDLCRIPFEAIPLADVPPGAPVEEWPLLVRSHAVAYVHSGTTLRESVLAARAAEKKSPGPATFLGFADPSPAEGGEDAPSGPAAALVRGGAFAPLPRSATEVLRVARLFARNPAEEKKLADAEERIARTGGARGLVPSEIEGERFRVRLGPSASERALLDSAEAKAASVLHLACHGRADLESPALSFLLLAPSAGGAGDPGRDGTVTLRDIRDMGLGADLVVLSACETNSGTVRPFEGIAGLSRAALAGGARSVLSTLWRVDDAAAADLVAAFYERWLSGGLGRAAALAEAKRDAIRRGSPLGTWSAYTLWDSPE